MFCQNCGAEIHEKAVVCVKCGCAVNGKEPVSKEPVYRPVESEKYVVTLLLCLFLGCFGFHRFYVGKVGTGVVQLLTLGGCGIWAFIDLIMILIGNFTDAEGKSVKNN